MNYPVEQINKEYAGIYAPEEHYFITTVFKNNLQNDIITTPNLADGATTFGNWEGMDYKYVFNNGFKGYSWISGEELAHLLQSKCLFGRKFYPACISTLWCNTYLHAISSKHVV